MHSVYLSAGTVPVRVTLPFWTLMLAPVQPAFLRFSVTFPVRAGSAIGGVGVGSAFKVMLFETDLTPSTPLAEFSALLRTVTSATSPLNDATPSLTVAVTPVTPSAVNLSCTAFWISASFFPHAAANTVRASARVINTDNFLFIFPPNLSYVQYDLARERSLALYSPING